MRAEECICTAGVQKTFYFSWINIYTNINSTNGGPLLCFIILFKLSSMGGMQNEIQEEAGDMDSIYGTLANHKSWIYPGGKKKQAISWLTGISQFCNSLIAI